jgi:hypothetical protein
MSATMRFISLISVIAVSCSAFADDSLDSRLLGKWQGARNEKTKCQFLAWNSEFLPNGKFEITFYSDAGRTKKINTERGSWKAMNGSSELTTDGVLTPEVYQYILLDDNNVKYVNTVKDSSADCQEDYEFTEHRVVSN